MRSIFYKCGTCLIISSLVGCKKFVDVAPPITQLVGSSVYSTNSTASAAVTGIYATMTSNAVAGNMSGISALLGMSADEFRLFPTTITMLSEAYANNVLGTTVLPEWSQLYNCIYQANLAIEGISASTGVSPLMKQRLIGEAKFIRAFCYFYLLTFFGDVPLVLTTDHKSNSLVSRTPIAEVYEQIITDLEEAKSLLTNNYVDANGISTNTRFRSNRGVATALLARVYLFQEKWEKAEEQATEVINDPNYQLASDLNSIFLTTNNQEAIWQLESRNNGFNAPDGVFIAGYLRAGGPVSFFPFLLSDSLYKAFEVNDLRKTKWTVARTIGSTTYYFPYKYKLYNTGQPPIEHTVILRVAEQFLIRAEARARKGNLTDALTDLNKIRTRANLSKLSIGIQSEIIDAILKERRFELFTEYGHRWLDLKRTDNLNNTMNIAATIKGGTWETTDQLYPIPYTEILRNPNLVQNPGY